MKKLLSFDDILITPKFSTIRSRSEVHSKVNFLGLNIIPIISSNMDTVTTVDMAKAMYEAGAMSCLHRFWDIEANAQAFDAVKHSGAYTMVSIGVGEKELSRAKALVESGARHLVLDIAHGASIQAVEQVIKLREWFESSIYIIAGNFATAQSIVEFKKHLKEHKVDAFKLGIGGGSACITRVVTGCGYPGLASLLDIQTHNKVLSASMYVDEAKFIGEPLIMDGGIKESGDYAKALAAGATAVMCGQLLAGATEAPNVLVIGETKYKQYRGSASQASYDVQGKTSPHRTPEGDSFTVLYSGPVKHTIERLDAGLRSAMSYVGASTIQEFQEEAELVEITNAGILENRAHGKKS